MNEKWSLAIVIVLAALFVLVVAYIDNANSTQTIDENASFNISAGHSKLSRVVQEYQGKYDAETIKWMKSLGDKQVFFGNDSIVIMSSFDAEKIPAEPGVTDAYIYDLFTADVIEKHALGDGHTTVYNVNNVKFIDVEIIGNGLA